MIRLHISDPFDEQFLIMSGQRKTVKWIADRHCVVEEIELIQDRGIIVASIWHGGQAMLFRRPKLKERGNLVYAGSAGLTYTQRYGADMSVGQQFEIEIANFNGVAERFIFALWGAC